VIEAISNLLGGLPTEGVVALLVIVSLQLVSQVVAFIDLARRREVYGGRKWVWVLVILLGNLLGAVLYFALGRRPDAADTGPDTGEGSFRGAGRYALDSLYGARSGEAL
jgi:hypothetical protein